MKWKSVFLLTYIFIISGCASNLEAFSPEIFGYSDFSLSYSNSFGDIKQAYLRNRTNIILSSEVFPKWDIFVNVEFRGMLKEETEHFFPDGFGGEIVDQDLTTTTGRVELEEAWASYTISEGLKVKAGRFYAPFGSFNVIQDQSPNYISVTPPMIYDDSFREFTPVSIIPDKANLELSGNMWKDKFNLEYHLYAGTGLGNSLEHIDIKSSVSLGARIVLDFNNDIKIGFSAYYDVITFDKIFLDAFTNLDEVDEGQEERFLVSLDADVTFGIFNINGEYIFNWNDNDEWGNYERSFFYTNLNAKVLKNVRLYTEIDCYKDRNGDERMRRRLGNGINKAIFGLNYKPNWVTAFKLEVQHYFFSSGYDDVVFDQGGGPFPNDMKMEPPGSFGENYTKFVAGFSIVF